MSKPDFSDQVLAALAAVQRVITQMDEQGVIIGGVAANLLGAPGLDWRRIEHWVRQFADVLEMPELWTDLARLRDQRKSSSRKDARSQR